MNKKRNNEIVKMILSFGAGILVAKYIPLPFIDTLIGLKKEGK